MTGRLLVMGTRSCTCRRRRWALGVGAGGLGGSAAVAAAHGLCASRCEWLSKALLPVLLVGASWLAVRIFAAKGRVCWLVVAVFLAFVAVDTAVDVDHYVGGWLLRHPARPIHRLNQAIPGLHLHTWPHMVLEAVLLVLGAPILLTVLWDARRDPGAAAALLAAGVLSCLLFLVAVVVSGAGDLLPFRFGGPAFVAFLKDELKVLVGAAFCLSFGLHLARARERLPARLDDP